MEPPKLQEEAGTHPLQREPPGPHCSQVKVSSKMLGTMMGQLGRDNVLAVHVKAYPVRGLRWTLETERQKET